jgi:hypothetical protein
MANNIKKIFRGAASTSNTTLYTVPSNTSTVVTNIVVTNVDSSSATFTLSLGGTAIVFDALINANSVATFDIRQVMEEAETIQGLASATTVNFHISGVEIS